MRENTVLVTGYAPAPKGTSMYELYKYAGIVLEIDFDNDIIVDAEFTFVTDLAKKFFKNLIIGYNINNGLDNLTELVKKRYWAPSTEAFTACLKVAIRRYFDTKLNLSKENNQ